MPTFIWRASASRASIRSVRIFNRSRRAKGDPASETNVPAVRPLDDDAGYLQLPVSASHGVGVDEQPLGQFADGGHFRAGREPARRHQILHLVDDLQVDRHAIVRGNVKVHGSLLSSTGNAIPIHYHCTNSIVQLRPWPSSVFFGLSALRRACGNGREGEAPAEPEVPEPLALHAVFRGFTARQEPRPPGRFHNNGVEPDYRLR